jgi:hypothetical protein
MDFKKFGRVVLILGIVVVLYGGFQWVSNQPQEIKQTPGLSMSMNEISENSRRSSKKDDAIKTLMAGGIVAFVGLGISYSANKKE